MADELKTKKIEDFPESAELADTDYFLNATGNVIKKTKVSQLIAWLKEKLGINLLNTKLNDYVMIKSFSKLIVLSNGRGSADFSISDIAITGYAPVGIVQCSFATTWFVPTGVYIDGSGAHIGVRDVGSPTASAANANCYITILYVKK